MERVNFFKLSEAFATFPQGLQIYVIFYQGQQISNGLIVVKLKRNLKYKGHIYFQPVRPHIVYQALTYLKSYNKFYQDISIAKGLSGEDMFKFSDIVEIQGESECVTEKNVFDGKEMTENINDRSETDFTSVKDPLNMHRTAPNEITLVSEIPNIITKCYYCTRARKETSFNFKR